MKGIKVAWVIGSVSVDEEKIRERGYMVRSFNKGQDLQGNFDDQPDLIIFSEADILDFSILFKMRDYYPNAVILSLPQAIPASEEDYTESSQFDAPVASSLDRLVNALQKIQDL